MKNSYRCLERAYEASKRIQKIKKDFFLYRDTSLPSKSSWNFIISYTNAELNDSVFIIYLNLLKHRICFYLIKSLRIFKFIISNQFKNFFLSREKFPECRCYKKHSRIESIFADEEGLIIKINRKLAWIEATSKDLHIWKSHHLFSSSHFISERGRDRNSLLRTRESRLATIDYESIGLLPRSITRTFSRFGSELNDQSSSLVVREFRLTKYQTLASLQYIGCLIFIPSAVSFFLQKCFLEPSINTWWNSYQSQIFFAAFQEEKALEKLQEIEELFWLDRIITNSLYENETQPRDLTNEIHRQTIEVVRNYNDDSIETILHLSTDIIYFITLGGLFISGKDRLVILNSWAQELFYSLSDTMKAFFILLLTDLCIGFHSPHGWEILISFWLEHFGFGHNKNVISCFVSTFPVILDTVSKYLIFRHLNRISPSIVATYHTMNE